MKKIHWFVLSLTLLFGILIGASSATIYFENIIKDLALLPRHLPTSEELLSRLDAYCDLDEKQEEEVIKVLRAHKQLLDSLKQRHFKEVVKIRISLERNLAPLLTAEQKEKVMTMLKLPPQNFPAPKDSNSSVSE